MSAVAAPAAGLLVRAARGLGRGAAYAVVWLAWVAYGVLLTYVVLLGALFVAAAIVPMWW